ncbi:GNAT family N-acetyltransferase [Pseudonocardia xishanensis]|uniref:GNAT family N-acetyltransferase n=1 Tax=Pseudonocardia xishanensis TaxID=630995 RepID=A0ABP8S026_9PSEU
MTQTTVGATRATSRAAAVRPLGPERWQEAYDLFMAALHVPPTTAERWEAVRGLYVADRVYGAFEGDDLVGTIMSSPQELTLPGGSNAPVAGVSVAGVRNGATRRGHLDRMVRTQILDLAARGEVFAALRPSTAALWHRWGVGPATRTTTVRVDRLRSGVRRELADRRDRARQLSPHSDLHEVLPPIHRRIAACRAGVVSRPDAWWACWDPYAGAPNQIHVAVAGPAAEPSGYVAWYVEYQGGGDVAAARRVLHVLELFADTPATALDLWAHLLHVELVEEIVATGRPLDEDVPLLLTDPRAATVGPVLDELWLRIVDVPTALALRPWAPTAGESVVVEVRDDLVESNAGCYRIGSDGARRVTAPPDLTCPVDQLAALYLGDRPPSRLAAAGRIAVHDAASVARADRLFATGPVPWAGTMF